MTNVTMICKTCGKQARRSLAVGFESTGCRGVHETPPEPALCPAGHGRMVRVDGHQENIWR